MVAARTWLVGEGLARPDQILLTGRSYGDYLTLLALGKRPDLWAGGMAQVAITDFGLMYEDTSESLRAFDITLFGGTPQEKPAQYRASSPITYAAQVRAPVLLIQGRNDSRCPARQAEAYIDKMRALGKVIEVHWFEAGHARADTERTLDHVERMLRFAFRVLG
jgi:dipeptidyl aminopeptidase/acylaminoacyl peptidase